MFNVLIRFNSNKCPKRLGLTGKRENGCIIIKKQQLCNMSAIELVNRCKKVSEKEH